MTKQTLALTLNGKFRRRRFSLETDTMSDFRADYELLNCCYAAYSASV